MKNNLESIPLVILAAGDSFRFGEPKGLIKYHDNFLIEEHIGSFFMAGGQKVIVILGNHLPLYLHAIPVWQKAVKKWIAYKTGKLQIQANLHPERGQFSSIITGLNALSLPLTGVFITPVDKLPASQSVWQNLSSALGKADVIKPRYGNRCGHPILLSSNFIELLQRLPIEGDHSRLDHQINLLPKEQIGFCDVSDPHIVDNINTRQDLEKLL